jgi:hypothetical protein
VFESEARRSHRPFLSAISCSNSLFGDRTRVPPSNQRQIRSLGADNCVKRVPPYSLSPALSKFVQEDTREECAKFGEVLAVFIPRPHAPRFGNGKLTGVKGWPST